MRRVHVLVSGRVQGVFFRGATHAQMRALGLSGWVRNLADGRVEAVVEGDDARVEKALAVGCAHREAQARIGREQRAQPFEHHRVFVGEGERDLRAAPFRERRAALMSGGSTAS